MSSCYYSGSVVLKPEVEKETIDSMYEEGYPFKMPKVLLEGCGEEYCPQYDFTWADDSVVLVRENEIVKYTQSHFTELLAENENGEIVWMDGRSAPYSNCWDGKYLGESREVKKYEVEVFDINTSRKTTYNITESKTEDFTESDKYHLVNYAGPEAIKEPFRIENGVLISYRGADTVVNIPEGVAQLGYGAFSHNNNIEKVIVPASCVIIPDHALYELAPSVYFEVSNDNPKYCSENGCLIDKETSTLIRAIVGAVVPDDGSVTKIGNYAFANHEEIVCLNIPNTIIEIGGFAFNNCKNLKNVIIPETVVKLGYRAFGNCRALSKVQLPDNGLSAIEDYAFTGCSSLTNIDLPDSIICLGCGTFSGCTGLESVKLPASISKLANNLFSDCNNLAHITIPNSIKVIGEHTFQDCKKLTEINIPESVVEIGSGVFTGCESLSNVILPNSIIEIGVGTFSGCKSLLNIRIPESVTFVNQDMFCGCVALETVELPSQITKIGRWAFAECEALTNIEIPVSLIKIGDHAFSRTGLTNLYIPETVKIIEAGAFANCGSLKEVYIPEKFYDDGKHIFGVNLIHEGDVILLEPVKAVECSYDYGSLRF